MSLLHPKATRTVPLLPYTPLFRPTVCPSAFRPWSAPPSPTRTIEPSQHTCGQMRPSAPTTSLRSASRNPTAARCCSLLKRVGFSLRSEEHTSELQSLMRNSYAVFCLQNKTNHLYNKTEYHNH